LLGAMSRRRPCGRHRPDDAGDHPSSVLLPSAASVASDRCGTAGPPRPTVAVNMRLLLSIEPEPWVEPIRAIGRVRWAAKATPMQREYPATLATLRLSGWQRSPLPASNRTNDERNAVLCNRRCHGRRWGRCFQSHRRRGADRCRVGHLCGWPEASWLVAVPTWCRTSASRTQHHPGDRRDEGDRRHRPGRTFPAGADLGALASQPTAARTADQYSCRPHVR